MTKKKKSTPKTRANSKKPAPPPFVSTGFWLMKSEPESYSIDDFARDGQTLWTGVRNYQARNFMMTSMKPGDRVLFYHSSAEPPAVVGTGEVLRPNLPDLTALDAASKYFDAKSSTDHPIWFCAEVAFRSRLQTPVTIQDIRAIKPLAKMALLAPGQRLSIQPVSEAEFNLILSMGAK